METSIQRMAMKQRICNQSSIQANGYEENEITQREKARAYTGILSLRGQMAMKHGEMLTELRNHLESKK